MYQPYIDPAKCPNVVYLGGTVAVGQGIRDEFETGVLMDPAVTATGSKTNGYTSQLVPCYFNASTLSSIAMFIPSGKKLSYRLYDNDWAEVYIDGSTYYMRFAKPTSEVPVIGLETKIMYEPFDITLDDAVELQYALSPWWGNMERRATKSEVRYFLDPSNFAANDWMFLNLQGYTGVTASELNTYLSGKGTLASTGSSFVSASKTYNINEVYLVSHAIHESAAGTSKLAMGTKYEDGYFYDPKTGKKVKDAKGNVVKYLKSDGTAYPKGTYYNFYGYGAYDSDPYVFGIEAAVKYGWSSPSKAVTGGAEKISTLYINNSYSQNTLYKMRFNPKAMAAGTPAHQYATDIRWAYAQTNYISSIYKQFSGTYDLRYLIPAYK